MAYLREGRVHASREAYEGGDGVADYRYTVDVSGEPRITARIGGYDYEALWCWPVDSKRPYGVIPLKRITRRPRMTEVQEDVGRTTVDGNAVSHPVNQ